MCGKLARGEAGGTVIKRTEVCTTPTPYRELEVMGVIVLVLRFIAI